MPQKKLNLKKTVETTLENAKGWSFAKYPSSTTPKDTISIDVSYPQKTDPAEDAGEDYSQKPLSVFIRRKGLDIRLTRDVFTDPSDKKEKTSYSMVIRAPGYNFRAIETPDGEVFQQGNALLLQYVQQDKELNDYISIFSQNEEKQTAKWQLDRMMERARS